MAAGRIGKAGGGMGALAVDVRAGGDSGRRESGGRAEVLARTGFAAAELL